MEKLRILPITGVKRVAVGVSTPSRVLDKPQRTVRRLGTTQNVPRGLRVTTRHEGEQVVIRHAKLLPDVLCNLGAYDRAQLRKVGCLHFTVEIPLRQTPPHCGVGTHAQAEAPVQT
eukprot:2663998-Rhodomonas_salina.1